MDIAITSYQCQIILLEKSVSDLEYDVDPEFSTHHLSFV